MTLTPSWAGCCSSLSSLRHASSSVMSVSSCWVTCGIMTQLRAKLGAEMRWIRERSTRSTGPNFSKSTDGQGASSKPGAAAEGRSGALRRRRLDVFSRDSALAAAAPDRAEAHAELAREPSDRRARVDRAAAIVGCGLWSFLVGLWLAPPRSVSSRLALVRVFGLPARSLARPRWAESRARRRPARVSAAASPPTRGPRPLPAVA